METVAELRLKAYEVISNAIKGGITQEELASYFNISRPTVEKILRRKGEISAIVARLIFVIPKPTVGKIMYMKIKADCALYASSCDEGLDDLLYDLPNFIKNLTIND